MSSQQPGQSMSPPPVPVSPPTGVRRHHTISASSRRSGTRPAISEEEHDQEQWNDDEVVDEDWVGGVGVVGEKSSLHRQSSLPTRYHRAFQTQPSRQPGNLTPRTLNSLTAIAGHDGDEDDWEKEMRGLQNEEEVTVAEHAQHQPAVDSRPQSSNASPLSPNFGPTHAPSPPPAASGVRRHQSLTHGPAGGTRQISSSALKRSGTLQAQMRHPTVAEDHNSPSPPEAEEEYYDDSQAYEDEAYYGQSPPASQQQFQATSPRGRQSPWNTPGEWRSPGSNNSSNVAIDDVQRALSALEIASNTNQMYHPNSGNFQSGQSVHPPRFNPNQPPPAQAPGMRNNNDYGNNNGGQSNRRLQPLVTDFDGRKTPTSQGGHGPASASPYVPPIGHHPQQQPQPQQPQRGMSMNASSITNDRALTATGATAWDQKERLLGGRGSNPNLQYMYAQGQQGRPDGTGIPNVPPIPSQYLQQQHGAQGLRPGVATQGQPGQSGNGGQSLQGFVNSPIDVPSLIALKGYNPSNFDIRPQFARFFVIKSYTEDDVHKSLKYEIWSSTDPGNKRLDKAFKECAGRGPIYLFFSVNASGHFCGMAEMLTQVDYTRSSTVWASDKWKGVFKVRWIFVRDIPNANLRHIRLNNTQERKPVTNSRDTQELLPDAGQEMLRIFSSHPARTSLLQDFAFYELQAMQKIQVQPGAASSDGQTPPLQSPQPQQQLASPNSSQQNPFPMASPNALYGHGQMPQMTPMMQMQMQMNMPMNPQFASHPQAQAMHQSVMRHPSPGPGGPRGGQQGFIGMGTQGF